MGDIYSNALLTISAAVGEDSHAGLFVERDPRKTYPCPLNFQCPKEDGVITKGAFLVCHDWYMPEPAYLDKRGWTFQGKYLSPRILCFSEMGISWTCASKTASEGLSMGLAPLNNKSDFDKYIRSDAAGGLSSQVHMRHRFYLWYQAMEIYSHRIFTRESDRLKALAGLAAKFRMPGDEFLYGPWELDLAYGLAWRITDQIGEYAADASLTSSIPSWSWASHPGKLITYAEIGKEEMAMESNGSMTSKYGKPEDLPIMFFEVICENLIPPALHLAPSSRSLSLKLRGLLQTIIPAKSGLAYFSDDSWHRGSFLLFRCAFFIKDPNMRTIPCRGFLRRAGNKGRHSVFSATYALKFVQSEG